MIRIQTDILKNQIERSTYFSHQIKMPVCGKELIYASILMCGSMICAATIAFSSASIEYIDVEFGPLSLFETASFQAAPSLSAIIAPFLFNFLLKKSRRKVISGAIGISGVIFWLVMLTMNSKHFWITIVIRCLHGVIMGGIGLVIPIYIVEIAPSDARGFFGVLHTVSVTFGHSLYNLLGAIHSWRLLVYVTASFLFILGAFIWLVPDSPAETGSKIKESVCSKKHIKPLLISCFMMVLQQSSGIGAILSNVGPLMLEAGLNIDPGYQAAIATSSEFFSCIVGAFVMDKFGRRKMWIFSSAGSAIFLLVYALNVKMNWATWVPMVALFAYLLCFGVGLASIPWFLIPEMFSAPARASGMAIASATSWSAASVATFMFPYMKKAIGQFGLMLYLMGVCILCTIFGIFFVKDSMVVVGGEGDQIGDEADNINDVEQMKENLIGEAPQADL
ncbi:major facilitator superfamily transporter [Tritrichomonas foetus]|uniref:Major facilitator superfamily transporter n=1 Tax=Tritrichomonas foetus TaxID=1144522 RepID=A0A1J4L550_9EUKA|nr:major facilitator superfamily transporter [Tritrichomonas foetus]|eukprot:OHT17062.1 major facilitator superfamily transporter [Tritrichomonas foetus]